MTPGGEAMLRASVRLMRTSSRADVRAMADCVAAVLVAEGMADDAMFSPSVSPELDRPRKGTGSTSAERMRKMRHGGRSPASVTAVVTPVTDDVTACDVTSDAESDVTSDASQSVTSVTCDASRGGQGGVSSDLFSLSLPGNLSNSEEISPSDGCDASDAKTVTSDASPVTPSPSPKPREPKPKEPILPPSPAHGRVVAAYFECFELARGKRPAFSSRDGASAKKLLELLGETEAIATIREAFANPWFVANVGSLIALAADPNKYRGHTAPLPRGYKGQLLQHGPSDWVVGDGT